MDVSVASENCVSTKKDQMKIWEMAAIFRHPRKLVIQAYDDVKLNGMDIIKEIIRAYVSYRGEKWFDMGKNIGMAGATVLFGKEAQEQIKVARFMQGITQAYGGDVNIVDMVGCTLGKEETANIFDSVFTQAQKSLDKKNTD